MVIRKGDADAGGVLVILRGRTGNMVADPVPGLRGRTRLDARHRPGARGEDATDAYVKKQVSYDPDLWVIEFDAADYLPPFEGKIV